MKLLRWMSLCAGLLLLAPLAWAACTPSELNTLLTNDADGIGFATPIAAGNDISVRNLANAIQGGGTYTAKRTEISTAEIIEAFDQTEFDALTDGKVRRLTGFLALGKLNPSNSVALNLIKNIFPNAGTTQTNLDALTNHQLSWAQLRCGKQLTLSDISAALRNAP